MIIQDLINLSKSEPSNNESKEKTQAMVESTQIDDDDGVKIDDQKAEREMDRIVKIEESKQLSSENKETNNQILVEAVTKEELKINTVYRLS